MFFFTDRERFVDIFAVIRNLPKNCGVIVREYDLSPENRLAFAKKIIEIVKKEIPQKSLKILIGKDWNLARKIKADGVHFSDQDNILNLRRLSRNYFSKKRSDYIFSYSCHNKKSIREARKLGCDLIFYSPIFATKSHQNQKPIGVFHLRKVILENSSIPIYPLGGIDENNLKKISKLRIGGFGAIGYFENV